MPRPALVPFGPVERAVADAVRAAAAEALAAGDARLSEQWQVFGEVGWPQIVLSPTRGQRRCPLLIDFHRDPRDDERGNSALLSTHVHEGIGQDWLVEAESPDELAAHIADVAAAVIAGRVKIRARRPTPDAEWRVGFEFETAERSYYDPDPGYIDDAVREIFGRETTGSIEECRPACLSYDGRSPYE